MPRTKLTDAAVQRFTAGPGARVDYFDATLPGFALRVSGPTGRSPEGRKSWILFYRFRGKQKRLTLEPVYPALGLAAARRRAGDALAQLSEGNDPATIIEQGRRPGDMVATVVTAFIADRSTTAARRKKEPWSPRYIEEVRRNFDNHIIPRWGIRDIGSITRRDINELLDAVADEGTRVTDSGGKKRHVKGGPIAANRILTCIQALFTWAVRRGIVEATPATGIEPRGEEKERDRYLSDGEIKLVWPAFLARGYPFGHFYRMALLTGQRRDEVAGMRWDEVDEKERVWHLSADRTKAGRDHIVPLSDAALAILQDARKECQVIAKALKLEPGRHVFSTNVTAPISGFSRAKTQLDKDIVEARNGADLHVMAGWRLHDLRRTVATKLAESGTSRFVVARILNHAQEGETKKYDRYDYLAEKRVALDAWARRLESLLGDTSSNVFKFPAALP